MALEGGEMRMPEKTTILNNILVRLDNAIKAENDLIGTRITWLTVSTSFTLSAFAVIIVRLQTKCASEIDLILHMLLWFMPLFGISLAMFVLPSLRAAFSALEIDKKARESFARMYQAEVRKELEDNNLRIMLISSKSEINYWGNFTAKWIPWLIILIWVVIMLYVGVWSYHTYGTKEMTGICSFTIIYLLIVWSSFYKCLKKCFKKIIISIKAHLLING